MRKRSLRTQIERAAFSRQVTVAGSVEFAVAAYRRSTSSMDMVSGCSRYSSSFSSDGLSFWILW